MEVGDKKTILARRQEAASGPLDGQTVGTQVKANTCFDRPRHCTSLFDRYLATPVSGGKVDFRTLLKKKRKNNLKEK